MFDRFFWAVCVDVRYKRKTTTLSICLGLVKNRSKQKDFYHPLPDERDLKEQNKLWRKFG
ncbi:hypothetical protein GCM10007852_35900 [Agaribacter marinus]|uniref:Uncharacterized protein n=1 Tax=Agaribacter marinus TaxID=1431249 RepID=A0AA37T0N8_9ALTE|nr:hypothetical protein GCM10007852_35900 [Agaribacter marinus]